MWYQVRRLFIIRYDAVFIILTKTANLPLKQDDPISISLETGKPSPRF